MAEGEREVDKVCRTVKVGSRVTINMDPFWYLEAGQRDLQRF